MPNFDWPGRETGNQFGVAYTHQTQEHITRAGRYYNFSARYINITIYHGFYNNLYIDCSVRVFRSFSLICTRLFFSSIVITNLLPSKHFLGTVKPQ